MLRANRAPRLPDSPSPPTPPSKALGVPMERLALLIHTFGVVLASISPISSWAGLQIGYVASVLQTVGLTCATAPVPFTASFRLQMHSWGRSHPTAFCSYLRAFTTSASHSQPTPFTRTHTHTQFSAYPPSCFSR